MSKSKTSRLPESDLLIADLSERASKLPYKMMEVKNITSDHFVIQPGPGPCCVLGFGLGFGVRSEIENGTRVPPSPCCRGVWFSRTPALVVSSLLFFYF